MSTTDDVDAATTTVAGSDDAVNIVTTVIMTTQYVTMNLDSASSSSTATQSDVSTISTDDQASETDPATPVPSTSTADASGSIPGGTTASIITTGVVATISSSITPLYTSHTGVTISSSSLTSQESTSTSIPTSLPSILLPPASTLSTMPSALAQAPSRVETLSTAVLTSSTTSAVAAGTAVSEPTPVPNVADAHRQAMVGGIAGAMGSSVFIAVLLLLCLCDRRKRKRSYRQPAPPPVYEARPPMIQAQSSFAPIPYFATAKRSSVKSFRTADGNMIHINVDQFARPFAEQEGWRESVGPRRLQVMNPDRSLPQTPHTTSDRMPGFFAGRYRTSPQLDTSEKTSSPQVNMHDRGISSLPPKLPMIQIEESSPKEYLTPQASPGWPFKTPAVHTVPVVDTEQSSRTTSTIVPSHSQPTMRTPTTIANILHAFRSKSSQNVVDVSPQNTRYSTTQYSPSSSTRVSSITDPFELESPNIRQGPRFIMQKPPRAVLPPDLKPFEGT